MSLNSRTEERKKDPDTGGEKGVKLERYEFLPVSPLREVARVYGYGARKYADRNWERGYNWSWSYGALQRHVNAFWGGEELDPESGLPHLAHATFHLLALMEFGRTHPEKDDRSFDVKEVPFPPLNPDPFREYPV
jgi:hypothetical protein